MNEFPEVPAPLPEVPRGKLWRSLAIPPVVTIIGSVIAGSMESQHGYLYDLPLLALPVGLVATIIALVLFIRAWQVRDHGWTVVLAGIGFFLGQTVLCLVLWFACCIPWITDVHSRL